MNDMQEYLELMGYSAKGNSSIWLIIITALALAGTVAAAMLLIGQNKRTRLSGVMLKLFSHVNFENFVFAVVVKILYVFLALFLALYGFYTMVSSNFLTGLLVMVIGPLLVRIYFELMMVFLSILDQIKETNRLLGSGTVQPYGGASRHGGYPGQPGPRRGRYESQAPPQPEDADDQPKKYPGGYDPMHRG